MARRGILLTAVGLCVWLAAAPAWAIDAVSFGLGRGVSINGIHTWADAYRMMLRWDWQRRWYTEGDWYVSGYWEGALAYLDSEEQTDHPGQLTGIGAAPVFRLRQYTVPDARVHLYFDGGIGPYLLSETRLGRKEISTHFQFGTQLGFGTILGEDQRLELGYQFWHVSNANLGGKNPGMNFHLLQLTLRF